MAKQVRQFRYYGVNHKNNYPVTNTSTNISSNSLIRGDLFDDYTPIVKLGIQTLPGTTFFINDPYQQNPIIIGYTGLYELDVTGITEINKLSFKHESITRIEQAPEAYIIIDIIYEKEGE